MKGLWVATKLITYDIHFQKTIATNDKHVIMRKKKEYMKR